MELLIIYVCYKSKRTLLYWTMSTHLSNNTWPSVLQSMEHNDITCTNTILVCIHLPDQSN